MRASTCYYNIEIGDRATALLFNEIAVGVRLDNENHRRGEVIFSFHRDVDVTPIVEAFNSVFGQMRSVDDEASS